MTKAIFASALIAGAFTWATIHPKDQSRIEKVISESSCSVPLTIVPAPVPWLFNWYSEGQLT